MNARKRTNFSLVSCFYVLDIIITDDDESIHGKVWQDSNNDVKNQMLRRVETREKPIYTFSHHLSCFALRLFFNPLIIISPFDANMSHHFHHSISTKQREYITCGEVLYLKNKTSNCFNTRKENLKGLKTDISFPWNGWNVFDMNQWKLTCVNTHNPNRKKNRALVPNSPRQFTSNRKAFLFQKITYE